MTHFLNSSKDCKKKCNRTEYIPGPQGPQGATGPQGDTGPSGSTNYISGITNFINNGSNFVSIPASGLTINSPVLLTFYTIPTAAAPGTSTLIIPTNQSVSITKDIANSQVVITFSVAFLAQIDAIGGISINYFIGGLIPPLAN
jgi:hypothetical protein